MPSGGIAMYDERSEGAIRAQEIGVGVKDRRIVRRPVPPAPEQSLITDIPKEGWWKDAIKMILTLIGGLIVAVTALVVFFVVLLKALAFFNGAEVP